MTNGERFRAFFARSKELDRAPVIEWATWWDLTLKEWHKEGLPEGVDLNAYWGLDELKQFWLPIKSAGCPAPASHGAAIMETEEDYERIRPFLFGEETLAGIEETLRAFAQAQPDCPTWFSMDGFFWFPRTLFGIEGHLYAFYDEPELMLRINRDLCAYHKRCLEILYRYIQPCFMTFAEDMSYNHGPMISRELYDKFMLPFYQELTPIIRAHGTRVFIDTDGFVEPLIPWFLEGGIEGILPLERMAGVDVNRIRQNYPDLFMVGGYDKTVMHKGEAAMRAEFERILPAIRSGAYLPGVDHQTPPDVSMENYAIFVRLLKEYAQYSGADRK